MSNRASFGGMNTGAAATRDEIHPRDSIQLPQSPSFFISSPADAPLKRGQLAQAMFDVLTLFVWIFLGLLAAAIVGGPVLVAGWMLFCS